MNSQEIAQEHLNSIIEFHQAVYHNGFKARLDVMFELLDALLVEGPVDSFTMLSNSPVFSRRWHSAYSALEDGRLDST